MKRSSSKKYIFIIVFTAVLSSLIFVGTFVFKVPTPIGYIHLGDGFAYIAAVILPLPFSAIAAALGGGLSDLLGGYPVWIPATVVIKGLSVIAFDRKAKRLLCVRNFIALAIGAFCNIAGYYLYGSLVQGNLTVCLAEIPLNLLQELAGVAIFAVFASILDANTRLRAFFSLEN